MKKLCCATVQCLLVSSLQQLHFLLHPNTQLTHNAQYRRNSHRSCQYSLFPKPILHKQQRPCSAPGAGLEAGLGHISGLLGKHQTILIYNGLKTLQTFMENATTVKSMFYFFCYSHSSTTNKPYFHFKSSPAPDTQDTSLGPPPLIYFRCSWGISCCCTTAALLRVWSGAIFSCIIAKGSFKEATVYITASRALPRHEAIVYINSFINLSGVFRPVNMCTCTLRVPAILSLARPI